MRYIPPTASELRFLIEIHWQQRGDPCKRAQADNQGLAERKVRETQQSLRDLARSGIPLHEAENQALSEVTLTD